VAVAARRSSSSNTRLVGVVIARAVPSGHLTATGAWQLATDDGHVVVRGRGQGVWLLERRGTRVRLTTRGGLVATRDGPLVARAVDSAAYVTWDGVRYRGTLTIFATTTGLLVVNRLTVEDYLRGVVPLEIGTLGQAELAALEAQAVAARSYTYTRLDDPDIPPGGRRYDLLATVTDQVYGGANAETPAADSAVRATEGEVITYGGHVVNAPYHSACGGSTAEPEEVWREAPEPYLQRVSDQIPGTDRYYCDGSAHFHWTASFTHSELRTTLERYLREYATFTPRSGHASASGIGTVRSVGVDALTPSGRVASLAVATTRGTYHVRGNDIRFVLRTPRGEILHSTYFVIEDEPTSSNGIERLTLRGRGNGHGVGMCQWGAIGRARAGQDYRTILQTYYPGTVLTREP
jgi:stage II sporulation protein D